MPETQEPPVKVDQDGLPVPNSNVKFDQDGLPIPVKKKDQSSVSISGGPTSYPLGSSPTPTATDTSDSKSDLHPAIFGKPEKPKAKSVAQKPDVPVNASDFVDTIDRATKKPGLAAKKNELTNKFFNADLTGEDIDIIRGGATADQFQHGLSSNDIAGAVNTKTKNLKTWANISVMKGVENYTQQLSEIDQKLAQLTAGGKMNPAFGSEDQVKNLQTQREFLRHSMTNVYNAEKERSVPKIVSDLKNGVYGGKDWSQIIDDSKPKEKEGLFGTTVFDSSNIHAPNQPKYFIKYDDKTHTLTSESTESILKFTDDWANKNKNPVLQAGQFGKIPEGESNYSDLGKQVVGYLNTVPQVEHNNKQATDEFKKKNKAIAPLIDHQDQLRNYFTQANNEATDAYVNTYQDKNFVITQEKYSGKNGIISTNPDFVKIQHKWAEAVANKQISEELAKKQIQEEINNNPALKKISDQYDKEIEGIRTKGREMRADYITKGIQASVDPNMVVYPSGNIGVKGMGENEANFRMDQYNNLITKTTAETLHKQSDALGHDADQRAEKQGAFFGSLKQASNEMAGSFYKWFFDKTGWGGDNMRMFQAEDLSKAPVTESDQAKNWNWQGAKSLLQPKFYASKVGAMLPVMAPAAIVTGLTEGAGLPESVQWLASAGVFTFQDALSFNNQLLNTNDKYGNKLTDFEAGNAAANQAREEFLPNLAFMALNVGTLNRAKAITKPTLGKAVRDAVIGSALGTAPMAVQGYLSYKNQLEAQGKKADMYDYMQDPHFATSMIDGFIGGLVLQLGHAPSKHISELNNWKNLIATSEGEFRNNSLYNVGLQKEINGGGNYFRDALKLHLLNGEHASPEEKAELTQLLQYSTALDRNIKGGGIDVSEISGAYQAHNLALADLHDQWAEGNSDNKNLAKIYGDQSKDFRDQAKKVMEGKGKFHYLIDKNDEPIFISDQSFKHLDASGKLADWIKEGSIKDIHSYGDPSFAREYKNGLKETEAAVPFEPKLEEDQHTDIVQALKDNRDQFSEAGKKIIGSQLDNPALSQEDIANALISQAVDHQGKMRELIGDKAFNAIKPIIDEQKALHAKEKEEFAKTGEKPVREEKEVKPEIETAYKPNIRDDFFAKTDFFTDDEKEKLAEASDEDRDKMIDEKRSELKAEEEKPENRISLNEVTDKPVLYNGQKATIYKDGQTLVAKLEGKNKEYELGNAEEIGNHSIRDYGIEQQETVVSSDPEGDVTVRGQKYKNNYSNPLAAINRDENGNVVSVNLETADGKKRTFRGDIAEDVAYQIHLKEINKDNATKTEFEDFINEEPEVKQEIENVGLPETPEEKPVENNGKVSREPAKVKPEKKEPVKKKDKPVPVEKAPEPVEEKREPTQEEINIGHLQSSADRLEAEGDTSPELQAMKERIQDLKSGLNKPPAPPVTPIRQSAERPREEFTAIRKEKQEEIEGAKELFENQKQIKWSDTYDSALHNVQAMFPDKNLYDAMKSRVDYFMTKLQNEDLYNPTSEDIAVFNVYKDQTKRKMAQVVGFDSPDEIQRQNAISEFAAYQDQLMNVVRVNNPGGEAGRAFNLLQSEIASDEENGLQIRRMELQGAKGGGRLSEADLEFTSDRWEKEKALIKKENELKEKALTEKFEKAIAKLREDRKPPTQKEKREKLLSQTGKELADKIRAGKLGGTFATFPGLTQAINLVIDGIAKLVEGGFTLAEAIKNYAKDNNIKDEEKFKDDLFDIFNKQEKKSEAFDKIKTLSDAGATDISQEMVAKNMIRDFVNAHVGLHDTKDVLDAAHADLQKILPNIEKNKLVEAYLKDGDYKQPTKKQLETGFKESERNFNRLTVLQKDINDLTEKGDLYKKNNNKTNAQFDKDVQAKEKEKNAIMTSMGIKTSGEDKYTKASYDQRAAAHNERLDAISKMIDGKISNPELSPNALKQLQNLKGKIDASKVTLDKTSALSQDKTLQGGLEALKAIKSEFSRTTQGDVLKVGDISRELQRTIDRFDSDKLDFTQNVKLQRAKDKAMREKDDFKRKIAAGEYEDNPIIDLTKADAELLKIKRDRDLIADEFYNKKREYEKENQSIRKRAGNLARAAEVTYLIGGPFTIAKVAVSAGLRPQFEAATKLTAGKLFEALPFDTTKAIVERAKAGGESSSIKSISKGYEAYFRQYSPEQLKERYQKASNAYEKSESDYVKMKDDPNADPKELQKLKNKKDNDLIDALNNSVYQFIGGSSVKESLEVLMHRSTELERELGHFDREAFNKKAGIRDLDNIQYVMNFVGRSHASLKNFSARYSFASGFAARVEYAVRNGEYINNPDKMLELAHASYIDWDRGKYQNSNPISDTWNKITNAVEKVSPEMAYLMKADIAITRVPVNMIIEGIVEYTAGALKGSVMAAREYYKAKGIVLQDGYTPESEKQFRTELNEQLKKIDPDTAATIVRSFRKGGFGLGLYALALLGNASFGGWAHKGQTAENKAKKKREEQTGTPELKVGDIRIGDWTLPESASKIIEHTPAFTPLGFGLGLSQVYKNNIEDGKSTPESAYNSAMGQVNHIIGSIPQLDKFVVPAVSRIGQSVIPTGQWDDVDQEGNPMKRQAFDLSDYFKYLNVPYLPKLGNEKSILSEHYYKEAVKNQKYYREQITRAEINTSLSKKEKDELRDQYLKELDESTKEIYRLNKEKPQ